jgi:hypothetical protein
MKTTVDLPDELVKALKLRAVHEGKKLKQAIADTLRAGLAVRPAGRTRRPRGSGARLIIKKDPRTGLPVIQCPGDAPARRMTVAQLRALEDESQEQADLERHGISPRQ